MLTFATSMRLSYPMHISILFRSKTGILQVLYVHVYRNKYKLSLKACITVPCGIIDCAIYHRKMDAFAYYLQNPARVSCISHEN